MKTKTVLYATQNPGKLGEVSKYLAPLGWTVIGPAAVGATDDVAETGTSLQENALLKAKAILPFIKDQEIIVVGDDTGVEIAALGGEPNIHVRRWRDHQTKMSDEEIIAYCIERMRDVPPGKRQAEFRTALAVFMPGESEPRFFDGRLPGEIVEEPAEWRGEGFPFGALLYMSQYGDGLMLWELHQTPAAEREAHGWLTHREFAVQALAQFLETLR